MTENERQLLIKDLCARLPYGVIVEITSWGGMMGASYDMRLDAGLLADLFHSEDDFKPYLRPMSSMTEKEKKERDFYCGYKPYDENIGESYLTEYDMPDYIDFLYEHHLDFRGLIPMGLALEAPADMYKFE
jgi:hypothetical protein